MKKLLLTFILFSCATIMMAGERYNFNASWLLQLGDNESYVTPQLKDDSWQHVTLPYAFNQGEAYSRNCSELSDTVMWYRKHFRLPKQYKGKRIVIEFEGARFGTTVYLNGKALGSADNGVMAFAFDLTPYILYNKENVLAVRVDNSWNYHELSSGSTFQWNNKNFYCNYGGINKNVWLHVMGDVYQTLPIYSNLGTTGVYVYATNHNIPAASATIHCEAQVVNSSKASKEIQQRVIITDKEGKDIASFMGEKQSVSAGDTVTLHAEHNVSDLHFWSWGYGYLYKVKSQLVADGKVIDNQTIETGFRKTEYKDGMFYLNDRVLQLKGFAQRSTNEWPALGISLPVWMTDYSNAMILGCNGNFVRWMHVTPSKQDVRSFDRLGLIQAMPAGDAEKDVADRRWQQRCELMRDAIIYNRNNPSVIFLEGGNNQISEEHMSDLKAIRDMYDPHGGRAIGSRNMLDSKIAEYGGEMLYVNKSANKPMWQMEYNRDEGIRRYWDEWSYPYHKEGDGPLYRGDRAVAYNHNQDGLAVENIIRWNEYWMARPGSGKRVNSGGAKIIFSDSNTHARGEKNYRTSGDVDAMRIPKDSWFVHKTMWDGWVDTEREHTYIIGHWNYDQMENGKPVYVCSTGDEVELFLNGVSLGKGERTETFLFTFKDVKWEAGTLKAVSYKDGKEVSSYEVCTVGEPVALRMRWVAAPETMRADGSDVRIAEIEAVDAQGRRHPLAHDMLHFEVTGEGEYLGGLSGVVSEEEQEQNRIEQLTGKANVREGHSTDTNGVGSKDLMLEAGVIRVMVRSTCKAGKITLSAKPVDSTLKEEEISVTTVDCPVANGFYVSKDGKAIEADRASEMPAYLERGETPATPSYAQRYNTVAIESVDVAVNKEKAKNLYDDNEDSEWSSDQRLENSWVKVRLEKESAVSQVVLRMKNFRTTAYPLQIFAGDTLVWEGMTYKCLGDCYINIDSPIKSREYTIMMKGTAAVKEAFGTMTELAAKQNVSTKESKSNILSIIEMSFNEQP
ncbi:MAG: DUF4982 domain-containing protein [Prevotella sp.]|nr:DUF4982 domain-containing protein [Candidatus Prevotella equi]